MDSTMADWGMPEQPVAPAEEDLHDCPSTEEFSSKLRQVLDDAANSLIPDLFTIQMAIGPQAIFNIPQEVPSDASAAQLAADPTRPDNNDTSLPKKRRKLEASSIDTTYQTLSVWEVLNNQPEKKPIPAQRAVAKSIISLVTEIDGFGYQSQNTTRTKDGWRLEYVCNDSYQNKARAGNRMRREEPSADTKEIRQALPTFDCKGRVLCTFSTKLGTIVVKYSHAPIHRTIASRKQQQNQSSHEKKPATPVTGPSTPALDNRTRLSETKFLEPNPLLAPPHGHGYGYPTLTQNPLYRPASDGGSGLGGSSTRHSSPLNSPYRPLTPNPLKNADTMSMVSVIYQHQRSASVDFSVKRSKALSLLAAAGVDAGTLSEYQMGIFQNQDTASQETSLKLFQDYGPSQLMIVARDMAGFVNNLSTPSEPPRSRQISRQPVSYPPTQHSAGFSNGVISNVRSGQVPGSSWPTSSSPIQTPPLPNPLTMGNGSRRSSLASRTEEGNSEDRYGAQPTTLGEFSVYTNDHSVGIFDKGDTNASTKNSAITTELTANGTPKQPGVFEFDPKKAEEVKIAKASDSSRAGKRPRKPVVNQEKPKKAPKTGCKTCGHRRKKCDQGQPICNNCLKDGKDCVYEPTPSASNSPAPSTFQPTIATHANNADNDAWFQDLIAASLGMDNT